MNNLITLSSAMSISLLAAGAAGAQVVQDAPHADEAARGGLEEIIVTARKRSESLQDVPVVVSAIPEQALSNNLASDLSKIAELAPQVSIGRSVTGTGSVLTIRGISSAAVDSGLDQSVGISVDGVSLGRGRILQSAMFDLQQVEIMQGPQALFFGKNSPAGVISVHTLDPTDHLEGYVRGGYEFKAKEKFVEAAISSPITDNLGARLAMRYSDMDGWIKNRGRALANPFQPNAPLPGPLQGNTSPLGHDLAARLTVAWSPSDTLDVTLKATGSSERLNSNAAYAELFCFGGTTTKPTTLGVVQPDADCAKNMRTVEGALPASLAVNFPYGNGGVPYLKSDVGLASLTINKSFDHITLTSVTGYYNQLHQAANSADYSEFVQIYDSERERFQVLNEELRLNTELDGPINGMVGAYFETSRRRWFNGPAILYFFDPVAQNYTTTQTTSRNRNQSYSVFGQLRWKILPTLELAGGARYSRDRKRTTQINLSNNPAAPLLGLILFPTNTPLRSRYTGDNVSPEATLTWKPSPDQTAYVAYKTGYKSGGISNPSLLDITFTPSNVVFGAERARGFEAGYKAELLDRRLRFDLAVYRYTFKGLQVTAYDPTIVRYSIKNAASARTTGITGSFVWLAADGLSLNGNIGYNRAKYVSFANAQCYVAQSPALGCISGVQDLSGRTLNRAPKVTFAVGADYESKVSGWTAAFSTTAAYSGSYQTATDYSPGGFQSSFWRLNASARIRTPDEHIELAVVGRNLTNSYYRIVTYSGSLGEPDQYAGFFNRPREVVVQASYTF